VQTWRLLRLWFGRERKKETLDEFFNKELTAKQRRGIEAACVDVWEPYLAAWADEYPAVDLFKPRAFL
jgi:hypothetical protein